jgi:2-oxoglutarate dehydrogenase E2 component (dihydrolipoamide succinyltransferase)
MAEIVMPDGSTVTSGQVIARIDSAGKAGAAAPAAASSPAPAPAAAAPAAAPASKSGVAMPAAAKLMADAGLSASDVAGSGRDGRITKGDVLGAVEAAAKRPAAPASAAAPVAPAPRAALPEVKAPIDMAALSGRPEQRVPMSRLRQRVAERLVQSQSTAAILTTFNEVNMQPVMDMRNRYKDKFEKEHGVKLGFMSFFVKAAVAATSTSASRSVRRAAWSCRSCATRTSSPSPTSKRRSPTSASGPVRASWGWKS